VVGLDDRTARQRRRLGLERRTGRASHGRREADETDDEQDDGECCEYCAQL
jgi:hypothetical protein